MRSRSSRTPRPTRRSRLGLNELELRFARPRELDDPKVGSLFVLSGVVLVQTIRAADGVVRHPERRARGGD